MEALGDLDSKKLKELLGPYEFEVIALKEESDSYSEEDNSKVISQFADEATKMNRIGDKLL